MWECTQVGGQPFSCRVSPFWQISRTAVIVFSSLDAVSFVIMTQCLPKNISLKCAILLYNHRSIRFLLLVHLTSSYNYRVNIWNWSCPFYTASISQILNVEINFRVIDQRIVDLSYQMLWTILSAYIHRCVRPHVLSVNGEEIHVHFERSRPCLKESKAVKFGSIFLIFTLALIYQRTPAILIIAQLGFSWQQTWKGSYDCY